ncbi:MAG TPA: HEAT repeat domain-containing protein [Gemmataceae bacterium]|jgi:hypothetical protein
MARFLRLAGIAAWFAIYSSAGRAVEPKDVDAAIKRGTDNLRAAFTGLSAPGIFAGSTGFGIGPSALSGIALLEAKVPANDPAVKAITNAVREASYKEERTYQIALCLVYLDVLEDPVDVPLIQMLAVRLLAGQNSRGGWSYGCVGAVPNDTQQWLKANLKVQQLETEPAAPGKKPTPKLHPNVEKYRAALANGVNITGNFDDNSNTQFGILGLWLARKHGVPVEAALNAVETRFLQTQDQNGAWAYNLGGNAGSGSMTAAGLLGLATGVARRDSYRDKKKAGKEPAKKKGKANDPFFTPAAPKGEAEKKPADGAEKLRRTAPVQRGLNALGAYFAAKVRGVKLERGAESPERDFYFLWSVERVGVIFGVDKIGGLDWYDVGATWLLKNQNRNGSWGPTDSPGGPEVNTSFALLFLCKADLLQDLSSKFRDPSANELRAGSSKAAPSNTGATTTSPMPKEPGTGIAPLPSPVEDESSRLASRLVLAPAKDWTKALEKVRDAKGGDYTRGLVIAIHKLNGTRKKEAREALAERLTRMSAPTLKGMMGSEDGELRRGAVLAAAMRDDKAHVPDLIERLTDADAAVVRAAHAGLKSLTSQDFGPKADAGKEECMAAATAWKAWWAKNKK